MRAVSKKGDLVRDVQPRGGVPAVHTYILWTLWVLAVVGTAVYQWMTDAMQQHALNGAALIVHCLLVGIIGIVMVQNIEMWLVFDLLTAEEVDFYDADCQHPRK